MIEKARLVSESRRPATEVVRVGAYHYRVPQPPWYERPDNARLVDELRVALADGADLLVFLARVCRLGSIGAVAVSTFPALTTVIGSPLGPG
jgi:hypothetical protein